MAATTIGEALERGAILGDLNYDVSRGYMRLPGYKPSKAAQGSVPAPGVKTVLRKPVVDQPPLGRAVTVRRAVSESSSGIGGAGAAAAPPFAHVLSLGARCVLSRVFKDLDLRQYAGPFDWVYTSAEMVRLCLQDNFRTFLDPKLLVKSGHAWGHKAYGPLLGRGIVFPHHEPRSKDRLFFERAVERFNQVLETAERKFFVIICPVASPKEREAVHLSASPGGNRTAEIQALFTDLRTRGVQNFQLLAIHMMENHASEAAAAGGGEPLVRPICQAGSNREHLFVLELHLLGHFTGVNFKSPKDEQALRALLAGQAPHLRSFKLKPDPLPPRDDGKVKRRALGDVREPGRVASKRPRK